MTARIDLNGARTQQERTLTILETRLDPTARWRPGCGRLLLVAATLVVGQLGQ